MLLEIQIPELTTIDGNKFKTIPKLMGIYMIYDIDDILLYVGKSENLYSRIRNHITAQKVNTEKTDQIRISYFTIESRVDLDIYETYLINKYRPLNNSAKLWYKKDESNGIVDKENKDNEELKLSLRKENAKLKDELESKEYEYFSVAKVAELLKVSKTFVYELVMQNRIEYIRLSKRRIRIPSSMLDELKKYDFDNNKSINEIPRRGRKPNGTIKK